MITFSELYLKLSESELTEFKVVTKAQRRKIALRMKKMMKSSALGGPALNLFPMWVRVSSWTPVTPILRGSLPSKNPDHGLSSQYLWYVVFMVAALTQEKIKFSLSFKDFNQNMF